jgi:hypothetical protein
MKSKHGSYLQIAVALFGVALADSASVTWAASPIVINTFDNSGELGNWQANNTKLEWLSTQDAGGTGSPGAMMVYYTNTLAGGWQSPQPQRNLGAQAFDTVKYWSVSFDFKIDPASSPGVDAPYGHVQVIPVDSSWAWQGGIGWTAITETFTNWQHLEFVFASPYASLNALVFQVGDNGFSGDVIFYLDNIKINPIPEALFVDQFTDPNEANAYVHQGWSQPGTSESVATPDAGGATPTGSLKLNCTFNDPPTPNTYQQVVFQKNYGLDASRLFTYVDLDIKLDPASLPMQNGSTYGYFETIAAINGNWGWVTLGGFNLTSANTNWTHLSYPMQGTLLANGATNLQAFILKLGGGWAQDGFTNPVIVYIDNLKLWTPVVPPTMGLRTAGPGGLAITSTAPTDDWQRQNIVTPSITRNYTWVNAGQPVSYAFTLTNYPDAATHPGFEAHIYLVNYDTLPGPSFDETYPGVDWNAADLVDVKIQNNAGGGVDFSFNFKTNTPGANVNQTVATIHDASALGRWEVRFLDNTSVRLTTGSGAQTNFTIAEEVANAFAAQMTLHFGTFKNRITNNWATAIFSRLEVAGVPEPINETFPGPGLNPDSANPFWRLAADPAGLVWVPQATAFWLDWSLPDAGFTVQMSPSVTGPWSDVTPAYVTAGSTSKSAAVPAASLPAGGSTFFRMVKPN